MIRLLVFPHSHYCEKARWALDYKGIPFTEEVIMPGYHMIMIRRIAKDTSVPVIIDDSYVVQGSDEIISYLDEKHPHHQLTPQNSIDNKICTDIETFVDRDLGENIRQILYSYLLDYPDFICYCFTQTMPAYKRLIFRLMYPLLKKKIYQGYVRSDQAVNKARKKFDQGMDKLADLLKQKDYLVADQFSRADLAAASMLAFLCFPSEHPFPWIKYPGAEAQAFYQQYHQHPATQWARKMYSEHRKARDTV